jgi:putative oxidoreductase
MARRMGVTLGKEMDRYHEKRVWSGALDLRTAHYTATLVRLTLAAMFGTHLWWKYHGFKGDSQQFVALFQIQGYPDALSYYVVSAEIAAVLLLIPGIFTRVVSLYALPLMVGTAWLWVKHKTVFFAPAFGELPIVWSFLLVLQALLGNGALALNPPQPPKDM